MAPQSLVHTPEKAKEVDELIEALSFFPEYDDLHDWAFLKAARLGPQAIVQFCTALAAHEIPELRKTAAIRMVEATPLISDGGHDLWKQLLEDADPEVAASALHALENLEGLDIPLDTLLQLGRLGAQKVTEISA